MHPTPVQPWSHIMRIVLLILAAISAVVCILSAITLFTEARTEWAVVYRVICGAAMAVFILYVREHPQWRRSLEEKF
jgi:hypothetical protein